MNLCIDPILKGLLKSRGIFAEVYDSVLPKAEKQQMLEDLEKFASNWFLDRGGKDITEFQKVSIGAAIHDDVLSYFCLLYHILKILEKIHFQKNAIVFYQSISCELPDIVEESLIEAGVGIVKTKDRYPFLCYKRAFEHSGYSRRVYNGIVYDLISKTRVRSTLKPYARFLVDKILSRTLEACYRDNRRTIWLRPIRRLKPILVNLVKESRHKGKGDLQVKVPLPETNLAEIAKNTKMSSPLGYLRERIKLAKQGVFGEPSTYMLTPRNGLLCAFSNKNKGEKKHQEKCLNANRGRLKDLLKFEDEKLGDLFTDKFLEFYSFHFYKFTGVIRNLYNQTKRDRIGCYVVEYINPFMAQVLANLNKKIYLVHLSRFLNNQYFSEHLMKKLKGCLFVVVSSEFERNRILKQGFEEDSLCKVAENYFLKEKVKDDKVYDCPKQNPFIEGKIVLVTTPPLAVLTTFRVLLDTTFYLNYLNEIVSVLKEFSVGKIIVRPVPGYFQRINGLDLTLDDLNNYLLRSIEIDDRLLEIRDDKTKTNIEEDLEIAHLVIGTQSAVAIDSALADLDYVAYDNSVAPFPDSLNLSIFGDEGPVPIMSNKDELRKYLENYMPNYGRKIINFVGPYHDLDIDMDQPEFVYNLRIEISKDGA